MKILNTGILLLVLATSFSFGVEKLNPKKMLSATDRSEEQHIQEKMNFENKNKALKNKEINDLEPSEKQVIVCKAGQEERNLELTKKGSGCEVIYTKQGSPKVIAHQKLGTLRCDDVFHTLKTKLIKGGFNCEPK